MGENINTHCTIDANGTVYWIFNEDFFMGYRKGWAIQIIFGLVVFAVQFLTMSLSKFHKTAVFHVIVLAVCCGTNFLYGILEGFGAIHMTTGEFLMSVNVMIIVLSAWPWAANGLWSSVKCLVLAGFPLLL
jgi:hypothetical protein